MTACEKQVCTCVIVWMWSVEPIFCRQTILHRLPASSVSVSLGPATRRPVVPCRGHLPRPFLPTVSVSWVFSLPTRMWLRWTDHPLRKHANLFLVQYIVDPPPKKKKQQQNTNNNAGVMTPCHTKICVHKPKKLSRACTFYKDKVTFDRNLPVLPSFSVFRASSIFSCISSHCFSSCWFISCCVSNLVFHSLSASENNVYRTQNSDERPNQSWHKLPVRTFFIQRVESFLQFFDRYLQLAHRLFQDVPETDTYWHAAINTRTHTLTKRFRRSSGGSRRGPSWPRKNHRIPEFSVSEGRLLAEKPDPSPRSAVRRARCAPH